MVVACYGCVKVGRGVSEAANKQHLSGVGVGMGWGRKKSDRRVRCRIRNGAWGFTKTREGINLYFQFLCCCAQQGYDWCWPEALFFPLPLSEHIFAEGKKRRKTVGSVPGTSTYKPRNQVAIVGGRENREPLLNIHVR